MTRYARTVTIIHRRNTFAASTIMVECARNDPKIRMLTETEVVAIQGQGTVSAIELRHANGSGPARTLAVSGVFVAIGHAPRSQLVAGQIDLDRQGYVQVRSPTTYTSVEGVLAAGDVADYTYRQAVTAAKFGCAAAIDAERWLTDHPSAPGP